jgi:hypothetical protein
LEDPEVAKQRPENEEHHNGADAPATGLLGAPTGDNATQYLAHFSLRE